MKSIRAHNKKVLGRTNELLQELTTAKAIIGRTEDKILLRSFRIPATLHEGLQQLDMRLKYEESGEIELLPVLGSFMATERIAVLCIGDIQSKSADEVSSIEDIRSCLNAVPAVSEENSLEINQLMN